MENNYWAIIRKSDNYVVKIYGKCEKISQKDCEFIMKKDNVRSAFELKKVKISII